MEQLTLKQIAQAVGAECGSETAVDAICLDTRKITPGCLFIAIRGERFDGHDFIEQAYERGAVGVVTEREVPMHSGVIRVPDTKQALLDIAAYYRRFFNVFMVGVTGSVGKTSTKEMIAAILSEEGKTLKTEGNFNNEIGMPLTMFRLDSNDKYAVVEMGMSALGEIRALTRVCRPSTGVITNIGVSHLETLGSRENILKAKLEIVEGMDDDAPLILNMDDDKLCMVSSQIENPVIYYGIKKGGDITASDIVMKDGNTHFTIHYYGQSVSAMLPTLGLHNVYNALAGFCVGLVAGMEPERIVRAMKRYKSTGLRQSIREENGITVIADCYNASPDSMLAAIDVVTHTECKGRRICVFGDMLELGAASEEGHLEVGRAVARSNVDLLICFGEQARGIKRGAVMCGMKHVTAFTDPDQLAEHLAKTLRRGDTVIYKASRGMQLEAVIERVNQRREEACQMEKEPV